MSVREWKTHRDAAQDQSGEYHAIDSWTSTLVLSENACTWPAQGTEVRP